MANRFFTPNPQFCDGTGAPYAGGFLYFYASETDTPLNTYTNSTLTIANTNPVVLDEDGYPTGGNIFLQNLAYKVVLKDVNGSTIWTEDPVYSSDYSTRAKFTTGSGSPNGSVAGTAGSGGVGGIGSDSYWDSTNSILYICTTTGTTSTAVWTTVNASTAAAVVPAPQGYLTLTSSTPIITGDVTGATTVYYTPYVGNLVPVYNGSSFQPTVFTELSLTLSSSQASSTLYDVFVFSNSGVLTLVTGPAWTTSTAGAGARGTGASTTQISRLNGFWVNTVQITGRNGASSYTIGANQATYLGSLSIDSSAGQVSCYRSYGQSRKWGVWNAYNRVPIIVQVGDGTASWTYTSATVRPSNNATTNSFTWFTGLAEEQLSTDFLQQISCNTLGVKIQTGIGYNSTSSFSSFVTSAFMPSSATSGLQSVSTKLIAPPALGINVITCLEALTGASGTGNFTGTIAAMLMTGQWRG